VKPRSTSCFERLKQLLQEAGYDGMPVVLMHSTDLQVLANLGPVAKQLLEHGGFTVDMQWMDWQTLVSPEPRRSRRRKAAGARCPSLRRYAEQALRGPAAQRDR
jgi:hypothetical protein